MVADVERLLELPTGYRTILLGDFNVDQRLEDNRKHFEELMKGFNFFQRSGYSTHIHGGILDLIFDNKSSNPSTWLPSPFSDHFIIFFDL